MMEFGLGRIPPKDWTHVEKYPLSDIVKFGDFRVETVHKLLYPPVLFNQHSNGACVGFSCQRLMSQLNSELYDPFWLWDRAKETDEWPDTNPGDNNGTSVRAGLEVLRSVGDKDTDIPYPMLEAGISEYRWASTVDEVRGLISLGVPVVIGINWYSNFDKPVEQDRPSGNGTERWIGQAGLGYIRGGHALVIFGASDKRQGFKLVNSWGHYYPPVWIPYTTVERLMTEDGEIGLVTDRPGDPDPGDYNYLR